MRRKNRRSPSRRRTRAAFAIAAEQYGELGVEVRAALGRLRQIPLSIHCWQGDDVRGFEGRGTALGGGLAVTGGQPGWARNPQELRADLERALGLIPGKHRVNLHACYGEFGRRRVDRDALAPEHFGNWIAWARRHGLGLDFNPTFFAHPKAADGLTLTHSDPAIRSFWIEHGIRCRAIGAAMGQALGSPCVTNIWIPDGSKDTPADRVGPRRRLREALDAIFAPAVLTGCNLDAVEPKLFGIGSESYVAGSHDFYLGYAIARQKLLCLDAGHYHPTESIADKISSLLAFLPGLLLHVSRGVRWDSDHVVVLTDELFAIAREIIAQDPLDRIHIGLDYFDASINRVAAWVIGARSLLQALLVAILEPSAVRRAEAEGRLTARLAWQEQAKALPWGAVWDRYCEQMNVPPGNHWLAPINRYQQRVLSKRR